jgi:hypothetical protein
METACRGPEISETISSIFDDMHWGDWLEEGQVSSEKIIALLIFRPGMFDYLECSIFPSNYMLCLQKNHTEILICSGE